MIINKEDPNSKQSTKDSNSKTSAFQTHGNHKIEQSLVSVFTLI